MLAKALRQDQAKEYGLATENILEAALRQFEDFGLRRTTIEDIAQRAGVSRVTIYRHFENKEALVEAVILREARAFFERLDATVERFDTTDERLVEGFAFSLSEARAHVLLNRLLRTEPGTFLPYLTIEAAPLLAAARGFVAEGLGREVEEGRLPPLDVEVAAELLVRLVLSFLLTPESAAPLATEADARQFARRYLAPALRVTAVKRARSRRQRRS